MQALGPVKDERLLTGASVNEDAAVVSCPSGMALVQTLDFFTPIVNDPYSFGQIAAANALSDVYAMGGTPWTAMNIVCFPIKTQPKEVLQEILAGGLDKVREAGAVMAGGHSVEDEEIKFGLSVTGLVDPKRFAANTGLKPGDVLVLTKPLGTGVLATAVKARWENSDRLEALLTRWAGRLNKAGSAAIQEFGLAGATDVTGFGLGGHALELAGASGVCLEFWLEDVPFMEEVVDLASMGMIPAGSFANKRFCEKMVSVEEGIDSLLVDLMFDAQTSGGLLLGVPEDKLDAVCARLRDAGDLCASVGRAVPAAPGRPRLRIARKKC
ncbi:MAG: selenide, water dikinase [Desulfovibrionales bacterium]|nr:selenide, water dikinase [Desulfovibrionales bacterium]